MSQKSGSEIDEKSSFADDETVGTEDFRKELERLQIATIYSLVERVPMKGGGEINLLFLTNGQASEFNFADMDKVFFNFLLRQLYISLMFWNDKPFPGDECNGHQATPETHHNDIQVDGTLWSNSIFRFHC